MARSSKARARQELSEVRERIQPLLLQLKTGGKFGERLGPEEPVPAEKVVDLAHCTWALLESVKTIEDRDLHNAAWLVLMHLNYLMEEAGVPESKAFEELLSAKHPER